MATSQSSANLIALSAIPQVAYQTELAGATTPKNYRQVEKNNRTFAKKTVETGDNKGYSTGTPYATRKTLETHDVEVSLTEDLSSQLLGERAKSGFGLVTTTEVEVGLVWSHEFELLNPQDNGQLPAYGYAEKAGESASRPNARSNKYLSLVCGNFGVQGQGRSIIQGNSSWVGSGKSVASDIVFFGGSSNVILLEDMVQNYFRNTAAKLKLYPEPELGGAVHNVNCDFRDFNFSVNWNLQRDAGYLGCGLFQTAGDSESGAIRGNCEIGDPTVQFSFTMLENDTYDPYEIMNTMASISASLSYEGSVINGGVLKHQALFELNAANIVDIEHTEIEGKNGLNITTEPLALGQVMPVKLIVVNDVESYAAPSW